MAFTKIVSPGIDTTGSYTIQELNTVGVVTASAFSGPLTGNATGLTGTPNITVGTITAASADFSGNVSIGGTLTYEDVTNIDSVGLITARNGIKVGPLAGIAVTISAAGAITATGDVAIGGNANNGSESGVKIRPAGFLNVSRNSGSLWNGYTTGSNTQTSRILANGNAHFLGEVGIGTDNPAQLLTVGAIAGGADGNLSVKTNSNTHAIAIEENDGNENYQLGVNSSGDLGFYNSGSTTPTVTFSDNDRVGIGTDNPSNARLQVVDSITTTFGNAPLAIFGSGFAAGYYSTIGLGPTDSSYTVPPVGIGYLATSQTGGGLGDLIFGTRNVTTNTSPTERLRINSAGLVGIGTDNPLNGLDVNQSEGRLRVNRFSHLLMQNTNDSTTDYWGISARNGGELDIGYGTPDGNGLIGGDKLTITSAGNLGIGIADPTQKLMVKGIIVSEATNSTNNWMAYTHTDNTFRLNYNGAGNDEITITSAGVVTLSSVDDVYLNIPHDERCIVFDEGQKMITCNDGQGNFNLIAGKDNDANHVDSTSGTSGISQIELNCDGVDGSINFAVGPRRSAGATANFSNGFKLVQYASDNANYLNGLVYTTGAQSAPSSMGSNYPVLHRGNVEDGSWNTAQGAIFKCLGDGGSVALTTNDGGGNANVTFNNANLASDTAGSSWRIRADIDGTGSSFYIQNNSNVSNNQSNISMTDRFTISSSGTFSGSSSNNISDQRLKKNIETITDATAKIKGLIGRTFEWKEEALLDPGIQYGFVAQEMETVVPDIVTDGTKEGLRSWDKDGNLLSGNYSEKDKIAEYSKAVNVMGVVPILVESLKDAFTKIEALEKRLTDSGL